MSYLIKSNQADSHQTVSNAVLVVWSFVNRDTTQFLNSTDYSIAMKVSNPIVVVSDILSAKVSSTKDNYMSTAEVVLSSTDLNYSAEITSGDHAMLWMMNNVSDFKRIANAVLSGSTANDFNSGLKFVGRINSVREVLNTDGKGNKTLRYNVTMKAFSEFGTYVYYNPALSDVNSDDAADTQAVVYQMTSEWSKVFINHNVVGDNNISQIISLLIKIFMGRGPDATFQNVGGQITSPNAAMLIPSVVVKTLGLPTTRQENAAANKYSDVLQAIFGLQKYQKGSASDPAYKQFIPSNFDQAGNGNNIQIDLNDPVPGTYISPPQNFNNVTVWSLLQANMNPTLNEMYCTLRTSLVGGNILPTIILRQIPFSRNPNLLDTVNNNIQYTDYLSVPRWHIDHNYPIMAYNLGTSDVSRFNFFVCKGQYLETDNDPASSMAQQYINDNLFVDSLDIARNGLRTHAAVSTADVSGNNNRPTDIANWTSLVADFYINGQYKQNGSMVVAGVQAPIAIGDNLQFDNKVFHIESIDHQFMTAPDGKKSFTTAIGLSHGILTTGEFVTAETKLRYKKPGNQLPAYTDEEIYANELMIASSTQGRSTSLPVDPAPTAPSSASNVQQSISDATAKLKNNIQSGGG